MPHIRIEYSRNVEQHHDVPGLVDAIHQAVIDTGQFGIGGIRTRTEPRDVYAVADRHPDRAFVAIELRVGPGRTDEQKQTLLNEVIDTASEHLDGSDSPLTIALSTEITLIDASVRINRNAIKDVLGADA